MAADLKYLEGKKFCLVFARLEDDAEPDGPVSLRCMHGRASINTKGHLIVEGPDGSFHVPSSCYPKIMPSDGTEMLEDAEFFALCRVSGMPL